MFNEPRPRGRTKEWKNRMKNSGKIMTGCALAAVVFQADVATNFCADFNAAAGRTGVL
jgi:hypothetical protein